MIDYPLSQPVLIGIAASMLVLLIGLIVFRRSRKTPPKAKSLFVRQASLGTNIKNLLMGAGNDYTAVIPELEEMLLAADVGVPATQNLIRDLVSQKGLRTKEQAFQFLKTAIRNQLAPQTPLKQPQKDGNAPFVIYFVGVNGVGKTTSIGKIAHLLKSQGLSVMLVAADTFRAAAADQLKIWAEKNGVECVSGQPEADPSSVIVDGLRSAQSKGVDVVLVDTAGRLHTKQNLMSELQKMVRMSQKELSKHPDEIWLVVDAVTGQNGFAQAKIFVEAVPLSGLILTKYDATSKGGIIISIVQKTGLPIRYVGLGEKIQDLKPFDAEAFVEKMFAD